jgi:hypothetical protein
MTLAAQAQTSLPKQTLPNEKNNSWKQNGWQGVDSGFINAVRDTSFRPRFAGTMVYWPHAGADTSLWLWTGQKWQRNTGNLSGGDTTIINNNISNYFDSTFNITNLGDTNVVNNYLTSTVSLISPI